MDRELMKKAAAETLGTFVLVFFACGTAMMTYGTGAFVVTTALAFGLVIVAMAYSVGNVSGCHINPAVSIAMLFSKKISLKEFFVYVASQIIGATVGAAVLYGIMKGVGYNFDYGIWATNGVAGDTNAAGYISSIFIEIILTFVFVYAILGVTSKKENSRAAGLVIGLSLTLVHLIGINLTGTSVNPARSIGPALMRLAFGGGSTAVGQIWIFILAPLAGGLLAAVVFKYLNKSKNESQTLEQE